MTDSAVLVLQDGTVFHGTAFGYIGEATGEVCFNTGMTGYQEILTDPSSYGHIVTLTYPHIGNYGVNDGDAESDRVQASGLIVREVCTTPSNHRSVMSLVDWMKRNGLTGIQHIDTRALTRHLRHFGAMNGIISPDMQNLDAVIERAGALSPLSGRDLTGNVTTAKAYQRLSQKPRVRKHIAALDFGIRQQSISLLNAHGCDVTVYPATTSAEELLATHPDGVFLSGGPGDPEAADKCIATVRALLGRTPVFGIGLGFQLLALALGAHTYKLSNGHRGANHPIRRLLTGAVEITIQNHGFAVEAASLPPSTEITHVHLNDNTLEGFRCTDIPAFGVQFHPVATPDFHPNHYLFLEFISLIHPHAST